MAVTSSIRLSFCSSYLWYRIWFVYFHWCLMHLKMAARTSRSWRPYCFLRGVLRKSYDDPNISQRPSFLSPRNISVRSGSSMRTDQIKIFFFLTPFLLYIYCDFPQCCDHVWFVSILWTILDYTIILSCHRAMFYKRFSIDIHISDLLLENIFHKSWVYCRG